MRARTPLHAHPGARAREPRTTQGCLKRAHWREHACSGIHAHSSVCVCARTNTPLILPQVQESRLHCLRPSLRARLQGPGCGTEGGTDHQLIREQGSSPPVPHPSQMTNQSPSLAVPYFFKFYDSLFVFLCLCLCLYLCLCLCLCVILCDTVCVCVRERKGGREGGREGGRGRGGGRERERERKRSPTIRITSRLHPTSRDYKLFLPPIHQPRPPPAPSCACARGGCWPAPFCAIPPPSGSEVPPPRPRPARRRPRWRSARQTASSASVATTSPAAVEGLLRLLRCLALLMRRRRASQAPSSSHADSEFHVGAIDEQSFSLSLCSEPGNFCLSARRHWAHPAAAVGPTSCSRVCRCSLRRVCDLHNPLSACFPNTLARAHTHTRTHYVEFCFLVGDFCVGTLETP